MSSRFQRSITTAVPTARNAKRPTILQLIVNASDTPVAIIQVHHGRENSLPDQRRRSRSSALVALLGEAHVAVHRARKEEDELGVEQDQARLDDVAVVDRDEHRRQEADDPREAALAHRAESQDGRQAPEDGRQHSQPDVRHVVRLVVLADVVKLVVSVVADRPAGEREHEFGEGRVHIEKVLAPELRRQLVRRS